MVWYLMVPPPLGQGQTFAPDPYAPLSRWVKVEPFDTQSDCQRVLEAGFPDQLVKLLKIEAYVRFLRYGRCVAEDDPALGGQQ